MSKLDITYVVASPKQTVTTAEIKDFWISHWTKAFAETGAPEDGWQTHFDHADIVVALRHKSEIIACHLYTLYDLNEPGVLTSEYFSYLQPASIETLKRRDVTRLMSMEYLGVSPAYSQNVERLSLGKLMVTLATYIGESIGADAVFGTPITSTSTPKMMANVGAITLEDNIEKYGYQLCLQYVPTNPRLTCIDQMISHRADELWLSRESADHIDSFYQNKRAA